MARRQRGCNSERASEASPQGAGPRSALPNGTREAFPRSTSGEPAPACGDAVGQLGLASRPHERAEQDADAEAEEERLDRVLPDPIDRPRAERLEVGLAQPIHAFLEGLAGRGRGAGEAVRDRDALAEVARRVAQPLAG